MTVLATLQAETLKSTAGYGASVVADAAASGGKALLVDSRVTVKGTLTLASPATSLVVKARTDGTTAYMSVAVDQNASVVVAVPEQAWARHVVGKALAAGAHTVSITFNNPDARNLYLDSITFEGVAAPPTTPASTTLQAYLTGYSWQDNDPANSDAIAHPTATRLHAGGTGTYADPITMAVGYVGSLPDLPYGTLVYVPTLRRYFRIEDLCGACHGSPRPAGTAIWLDCWVGGQGTTAAAASAAMNALTGPHAVIKNPPSTYAVVDGEIAKTGVHLYGETPVLA